MKKSVIEAALRTVNELIGVYQSQAEGARSQAKARRIGGSDNKLTLELEASARSLDATAEQLGVVRSVILDSLRRRRFSRKRRQLP
jgi:hypothetical protein